MKELFDKRINKLKAFIKNDEEAILITNEVNIGYFTNFFHSEGYALVTKHSVTLLVDFRYFEAARKKARGCHVICFEKLSQSVLDILTHEHITRLYIESSHMTVSRFEFFREKLGAKKIELVSGSSLDKHIGELRIIKDDVELEKISTAQKIAEQSYLEMLNYLKPGVSERSLAARLEFEMKQRGAEDVSFDLITITGKKTSLPHGVPTDDIVKEGDFFTCDFGAVYEGYHSDTTRTVAIGSATDEMVKIYDIVLRAQKAALSAIKAGVNASDVDRTARDIITNEGYGKFFGHSTGHGVGLDIHELPAVSGRSESVLRAGMVITDEPGIYLPDKFGVRIEDMVCVTENGCRNFVSLPKELLIL